MGEFADAMFFSLRCEAFDAYQRFHGPFGTSYEEWFSQKLDHFVQILLYRSVWVGAVVDGKLVHKTTDLPIERGFTMESFTGDFVQPDELEALPPEDNDCGLWFDLAETVSKAADNRLKAAQDWLKKQRKASRSSAAGQSGWAKNQERDNVIHNGLARGMKRVDICDELDKRAIPTTPALQKLGFYKWSDGWADVRGRKLIQSLFSKRKPN